VRAAVLGAPVAHSLSPALHRAAYAELGLDWSYDAVEVTMEGLAGFLEGLGPEWAGLSLTMPLKRAVLPLLTSMSDLVRLTGAANTVVLHGAERAGHNTDVAGVVASLREAGTTTLSAGAVLGAGATASSAVVALAELGAREVRVLARAPERATHLGELGRAVGVAVTLESLSALAGLHAEAVVNTTPSGALDGTVVGGAGVFLDVVYDPWPTALAHKYAATGAAVLGGAVMLLHQAAAQVTLMTGESAPVAAMRRALPG
jgi:shikimate dehydrogenase